MDKQYTSQTTKFSVLISCGFPFQIASVVFLKSLDTYNCIASKTTLYSLLRKQIFCMVDGITSCVYRLHIYVYVYNVEGHAGKN